MIRPIYESSDKRPINTELQCISEFVDPSLVISNKLIFDLSCFLSCIWLSHLSIGSIFPQLSGVLLFLLISGMNWSVEVDLLHKVAI